MSEKLPVTSVESPTPSVDHSMDNWNKFKADQAELERDKSMDNWNDFKAAQAEEARDKSMDNWNNFLAKEAENNRDKAWDKWNNFQSAESTAPVETVATLAPELEAAHTNDIDTVDMTVENKNEANNEAVVRLKILAEAILEFEKKTKGGSVKQKDADILDSLKNAFEEIYNDSKASGVSEDILKDILHTIHPETDLNATETKDQATADETVKNNEEVVVSSGVDESIDAVADSDADRIARIKAASIAPRDSLGYRNLSETIVDGWYGLGAAMTGLYSKIDNLIKPARKQEETDEQYEKRAKKRKIIVSLGALAGVMLVGYEAHQLMSSNIVDHSTISHSADTLNHVANSGVESAASNLDTASITSGVEYNNAANTVMPGEGWYQTFKDMGVPKDEWANLLHKVGPQLQANGYAYPNSGSFGISNVGQLPKSVLELIQNSR